MSDAPAVSPTCEMPLSHGDHPTFCGAAPTTSYYLTAAGGTMALCESHGTPNARVAMRIDTSPPLPADFCPTHHVYRVLECHGHPKFCPVCRQESERDEGMDLFGAKPERTHG